MISQLEKEVTLRYLKTRKQDGFLNVISIFSFIGIALGVAVLIIVMSVMNGFRSELVEKIVGFNAHAVVKPYNIAIDKNKYVNSSGSLIAALNRIIDKAPTKPRDNANDDFTTKITKKTIELKIGIIFPRFNFPATDLIFRELNSTIKEENNSYHNSENLFFQKNIEANNISFKFPKSEKFLFQDISLKIYKNEAIGIYGETGAGKSTLIDILTGILKPSDGSVLCDNQEIEKNIKSWQSRIGYVPQEIFLIDDSIINNIAFGIRKEKINLKRINEVIKLSQLENFINTLPRGAETKVGERGIKLSGGQKQRIGIARALYKNPDLLIFDEATSSLDENTEKKIIETINSFKQKKTMIIISHRIVTLKNCDRTYKIENSKLIEQRV